MARESGLYRADLFTEFNVSEYLQPPSLLGSRRQLEGFSKESDRKLISGVEKWVSYTVQNRAVISWSISINDAAWLANENAEYMLYLPTAIIEPART